MRLCMRRIVPFICMLLLGVNMACAQAKAKSDTKSDKTTTTSAKTTPGFDINALDKSVDPCTNFYQFACGGWRARNPIPSDQASWGRFAELAQRNRDVLHEILEKESKADHKRNAIETQVGDYYAACMDESTVEKKGTEPIKPWLVKIDAIKDNRDLASALGEFGKNGLRGMYGFGASPDMKDSKKTIANASQGGTGLGDRDDYLKDDPKSVEKRQKYEEHIKNMLVLLGDSEEKAAGEAKTILNLETQLAKAQMDRISMRDPKNRDHKITREEFVKDNPNFDFDAYFTALGAPQFTEMNDTTPTFFKQVNDLLGSSSIDDW